MSQDDYGGRGDDSGGEPLSGPDNAWRRMGDRTNLMEITGVLVFDDPIDYADLREVVEERLLPFRRFRQRIVGRDFGRRPRWELDPDFDLDSHLHHVSLPEPQGREEFQTYVGDVMSTPIDKTKPLWQFYLVEGAGDGNALVVRIHHSIADGFALLYVMLGLADEPEEIDLPIGTMPTPPHHRRSGAVEGNGADPSPDPEPAVASEPNTDGDGRSRLRKAAEAARQGANMAVTGVRAVTLPKEPRTSLVGDLGVRKEVAWSDPIDVERAKAIGRAHGATINDVMLAATAGAFRRYLEANGEPTDRDLRCTMPVNLKPLDQRTEDLGNYFGLGFLDLPVSIEDPHERIQAIQDNTGALKQGTEAFLFLLLLKICGRGPPTLEKLVLKLFENKASAVVTNVPGPKEAFSLAGTEVSDVMFWVPQSNGIGIGVSILSYDGDVRVGVTTDRGLVAEPFDIAEQFQAELDAMEAALQTAEAETP
ncbi:wax ester/triacylglycerol synthase family O-acyltransferase [Salinirubellus salinus]|uniref:Wax ester/triacylglycerol synthase family O-acyltransferase n=1 Tax=Salinirubellus salinus TaxID=1364945 RepID=A0A9E7QZP7_9EURY|nr:wax ester/triacylglycerol synthase family O-acyltransferase [Salinirubellus salinus]UWM52897.1 wax ester/triacylglycerol synthase family O-acyltransferase [Salinirubellus salinus]